MKPEETPEEAAFGKYSNPALPLTRANVWTAVVLVLVYALWIPCYLNLISSRQRIGMWRPDPWPLDFFMMFIAPVVAVLAARAVLSRLLRRRTGEEP